jgi:TP901 family phage tail tape measure protein
VQANEGVWLPVLPSMRGFGPALIKGAGSEADRSGKAVGARFGKAIIGGVAIVGAGLAATGAALYKVGAVFDDVTDSIRVGTGATGKALDSLVASAKRVGSNVPADFKDVGVALADVNTRLGHTGKPLEEMTSQFLELSRITKTDVAANIANVSRVFGDWGVEADKQSESLDYLFKVSQSTGIGIDSLSQKVVQFGAPMRQFGFSFEESAALMGKWEKEGVNTETIMGGLRAGLGKLSKAGKDPVEAFKDVTSAIQGAGSSGEATAIAIETFGQRAGPDLAAAVREGRFDLEELMGTLDASSETIMSAGEQTMDFSEKWAVFKNRALAALEPVGTKVFDFAGVMLDRLAPAFEKAIAYLTTDLPAAVKTTMGWLEQNRATILTVAGVITAILTPALIRWGVQATIAGVKNVIAWVTSGAASVKTAALYVINSYKVIGAWVAMGAAAVKSGAQTVAIWAMYRWDSVKAVVAMAVARLKIVAHWGAMSAAAVASGAKTAAVWTGTIIKHAVKGALAFAVQARRVVAAWVLMSVQSLIHAARMAGAWLIAMGPIGWAIGAVVALAAVIIANWDKISKWTKDMWSKHVKPIFDKLISFVTETIPKAFRRGVDGIKWSWNKLMEIAKKPVRFVVDTVINKGLIGTFNKIPGVNIPEVKLPEGFKRGGYTGDGSADEVAGPAHRGEYYFSKAQTARIGKHRLAALAHGAAQITTGAASGAFMGSVSAIRPHGAYYMKAAAGMEPWNFPGAARMWDRAAGLRVLMGSGKHQGYVTQRERGDGILGYATGTNIDMSPSWMARLNPIQRRTVAAHEIGHAMGLPHMAGSSIMQANLANMATVPTSQDIKFLQRLYPGGTGKAGSPAPENPFLGMVDVLMEKFKKAFPAGGPLIDAAGGLARKGIQSVIDFVANIGKNIGRIVTDVTGGVVKGLKNFFGGGAATAEPYLHDQGGVVNPGLSTILNRTRKPEALLNPRQWQDIHTLASRGGASSRDIHIHGNVGWDPKELAREEAIRDRRAQTMAGLDGLVIA